MQGMVNFSLLQRRVHAGCIALQDTPRKEIRLEKLIANFLVERWPYLKKIIKIYREIVYKVHQVAPIRQEPQIKV